MIDRSELFFRGVRRLVVVFFSLSFLCVCVRGDCRDDGSHRTREESASCRGEKRAVMEYERLSSPPMTPPMMSPTRAQWQMNPLRILQTRCDVFSSIRDPAKLAISSILCALLLGLITVAIIEWNGIIRSRDSAIALESTQTDAGNAEEAAAAGAGTGGDGTTGAIDENSASGGMEKSRWTWTLGEVLLYMSIFALLAGWFLVMYVIVKRRYASASPITEEELGGVELQRFAVGSPTNESAFMLRGSDSNSTNQDANSVFAMPMLVYL